MAHITPLHLSELTPINFQWSFKPTFITLKVLGLHFEPLTRHQLLSWKILPIIYCLLCFSLYSACVIFSLIWMTMNQTSFLPDASNASWLSYKFENLDFVLFGAAMQAMSLLRQQRIPLARLMDNIETEFAFGREVYRRFRRLSIFAVIISVFWVVINQLFNYVPHLGFRFWVTHGLGCQQWVNPRLDNFINHLPQLMEEWPNGQRRCVLCVVSVKLVYSK